MEQTLRLQLNENGSTLSRSCLDDTGRDWFCQATGDTRLADWSDLLWRKAGKKLENIKNGHLPLWLETLAALPELHLDSVELDTGAIRAGLPEDCDETTRRLLCRLLRQFHPWRKGPFEICGVAIDAEWRSDWKWERVRRHIKPLAGRLSLDIGCGNGYYCWRMAGAGAKFALGIEPHLLFFIQFLALRGLLGTHPTMVLPLAAEDLPNDMRAFDTVFSMGVLYHLPNPLAHLEKIRGLLRPGGELVLETLVVEGGSDDVLRPPGRYAKMRNVYLIPSCGYLEARLGELGFRHVRTVDFTRTTTREQRSTDWMRWQSLRDYLAPDDPLSTCEGHPAPTRAVILAEAP